MIYLSKTTCFPAESAESATLLWLIIIGLLFSVSVLAADPSAIEPAALNYTQHRSLWEMDPNLTGQGTLIGTICRSMTYLNHKPQKDYRFNMTHNSLYDADVLFMDDTDGSYGISDHATSIAGILLGHDQNAALDETSTFQYRGVCPDAAVNAYEFEDFAIQNLLAKQPLQEDILLLSLGEMFEFWWVRSLEQAAVENDFLIVASNGNGSSSNTPSPLYPAAGSNVLSVGVINEVLDASGNIDFSLPNAINSSEGPTDDLRCKPDIIAPGTAVVPSAYEEDGYVLRHNWSSLSAPIVAGTAALLSQKGVTDSALQKAFDRPGKSLVLKAVLMNSAKKLPFWHKGKTTSDDDHETPLDYIQGAGTLDAVQAYQQFIAGAYKPGVVNTIGWDNRVLDNSDSSYEYTLDIIEPNQIISATLCWNRNYQDEYPFDHQLDKDADLRLELWGIDSDKNKILLDYSDSVNDNIEHIYFAADTSYRSYAVRVRFNSEQSRDSALLQRFALAWSVGPDRQIGNRWWNDLNADDKINETDELIYVLLNNDTLTKIDPEFLTDALTLSPDRIKVLTVNWSAWKPYLSDWNN